MPRPPSSFHGFIGQRRVVTRVCQQIAGARAFGEHCPHLLLLGESGVGKTEFSGAIAKELGTTLIVAHGQDSAFDLATKLLGAKAGDVFFIDEIHNAKPRVQEMLYRVIDSSRLPSWALSTTAATSTPQQIGGTNDDSVEISKITLILATDMPGRLLNALTKRLELRETLNPYPLREMQAIVDVVASALKMFLTGQARNLIARVSGGLPRTAKHHLRCLRRHIAATPADTIGQPQIEAYLKAFGIDAQGLSPLHRKLLRHLGKIGNASIEALVRRLGVDADYVQRQVEPQLLRLGLIRVYSGGRALTKSGRKWFRLHRERKDKGKKIQNEKIVPET